ncbi:MAG TPA: hypothetical protein VGK67_08050 [Myxococcales bacterium]|jgi:DNA-binding response OmpR family regulator
MTRVLLLADDPSIAKAAAVRLAAEEEDCAVDATSSVADAIERLAKESFDFVVVDRAEDCLAVAKKIETWLEAQQNKATLLVPTSAAFGLESVVASTVQHVRDLVAVIENAIQFRLSAAPAPG